MAAVQEISTVVTDDPIPGSCGRIQRFRGDVEPFVDGLWFRDLESLEAISQDDDARRIFLRMAAMSHSGSLPTFLAELERDNELDEQTKGHLTELANDRAFLIAVEDYLHRTSAFH